MRSFDWAMIALVIFGALNWGFFAITSYDLISVLFGELSIITRIIFGIIGFAGIYAISLSLGKLSECSFRLIARDPRLDNRNRTELK
jgi:uncharacterized membrane protein YuzA (DUF378 family)